MIYALNVVKMPNAPDGMIAKASTTVFVADPASAKFANLSLVRDAVGITLGEERDAAIIG